MVLQELRDRQGFREVLAKLVLQDRLDRPEDRDPAVPQEQMAIGVQLAQKDHRVQQALAAQKDRREPKEPQAQAVLHGQHLQSR